MPHNTPGFLPTRSVLTFVLVAVLTCILIVLAVLQYRWSSQVSRAERERMEEDLNRSTGRFQDQFYSEMLHVCTAFQVDSSAFSNKSAEEYAHRYNDWARTAAHPQLVADVYLWKVAEGRNSPLVRLNATSKRFERAALPAGFEELLAPPGSKRIPNFRHRPGPETLPSVWILKEQVPALVHPVFDMFAARRDGISPPPRFLGYTVVTLNMAVFEKELFPELAQHNFGGPDGFLYQAAIVAGGDKPRVLYRSSPEMTANFSSADAVVDLPWGPALRRSGILLREWELGRLPAHVEGGLANPESSHDAARQQRRLPRIVIPRNEPVRWRLVVKHRAGSLDAAVASIRLRNLALSFGVLLLLALSMVMVFVSTHRARKLAKLQMEFVAGVSHELRTPLAVICSAADNLAAGVVEAKQQIQQYGTLIGAESRRLSQMVQQILLFASGQSRRARYDLRPVQVDGIVDRALAETRSASESADIAVEKTLEPNLPPVMADANALTHCLENLISNAIKYGGESRWIGIRAQTARGPRGPELQLVIEDRGMGIDETELDHIFEPFFRGQAATAAQIHGTGLGLSLARGIAEAMGGRITVKSTAGRGTSFILNLPVSSEEARRHHTQA